MNRFLFGCATVCLLAVPVAYFTAGPNGGAGLLLGLGATTFNMLALWAAIKLTGSPAQGRGRAMRGAIFTVLVFLLKLPVFVAAMMLAQRIGDPAPTCFLIGLALVYSSTVGWALARR